MSERMWARARSLTGTIGLVVAASFATRVNDVAARPATENVDSKRIRELMADNRLLVARVASLEESVSHLARVASQPPSKVQAPFEVVDAAGNSLFVVTEGKIQPTHSRVTIGRTGEDNFMLAFRNGAGAVVATMGQLRSGAGGMLLSDPAAQASRTEIVGDSGIFLNNPQGKQIANLGFSPGNNGRSRLWVNGELRTVDGAGNPIFVATDAPLTTAGAGRVLIGQFSDNTYGMMVHRKTGASVVTIGELKEGFGVVHVGDEQGKSRASIIGNLGLVLRNNEYNEVANLGFDPANNQAAWLRVMSVGGSAKPIFTVSDVPEAPATVGRVHIGRGAESNYGLWVRGDGGKIAAAIGEGKTGGGVVSVRDPAGKPRAELFGQGGLELYSPAGKEVGSLNLKGDNLESAVFHLRGLFQLSDAAGQTTVEAGTSPNGVGVVRVGPMTKCVPMANLRVPDCIMGRSQP